MFRTSFGAVAWVMTGIGASAVLTSGMAAPSVAARGGEACRLRAELQQAEPSRCDEPVVIRCGTGDPDEQPGEAVEPVQPELVHAVEPKPLGPAARKGLAWLVERQRQDGGWNQGEGGNGGREGEEVERSNVGDTCMAARPAQAGRSCAGEPTAQCRGSHARSDSQGTIPGTRRRVSSRSRRR
jgi:hypothetical protein